MTGYARSRLAIAGSLHLLLTRKTFSRSHFMYISKGCYSQASSVDRLMRFKGEGSDDYSWRLTKREEQSGCNPLQVPDVEDRVP